MSYKYYNPNPHGLSVGDCVVRAISKALNISWDKAYIELCIEGYLMKEFGDGNRVWDSYLRGCGFVRKIIPNTCPDCYTVREFCYDHPYGVFVLSTGSHLVTVIDGDWFDSFNSADETPIFYYERH